jgi:tRNA threonylcarbamoyladenosine biosynthesis protein TsaE
MNVFESPSENDTYELGYEFGQSLKAPAVVLLSGSLGAGKTVFVRGIASAFGVDGRKVVRSPSFSLVNLYETPICPIYHVDLYRLDTSRDLHSIGIEDILASDAIVLIEWADKLAWPVPGSFAVRVETDSRSGFRRIAISPPER